MRQTNSTPEHKHKQQQQTGFRYRSFPIININKKDFPVKIKFSLWVELNYFHPCLWLPPVVVRAFVANIFQPSKGFRKLQQARGRSCVCVGQEGYDEPTPVGLLLKTAFFYFSIGFLYTFVLFCVFMFHSLKPWAATSANTWSISNRGRFFHSQTPTTRWWWRGGWADFSPLRFSTVFLFPPHPIQRRS